MNVPPLGAVVPSSIQPGAPALDGPGGFATLVVPGGPAPMVNPATVAPSIAAPSSVALAASGPLLPAVAGLPKPPEVAAPPPSAPSPVSETPAAAFGGNDPTFAAAAVTPGTAEPAARETNNAIAADAGRFAAMGQDRLVAGAAVAIGAAAEAVDAKPTSEPEPDPATPQRPTVPPDPVVKESPQPAARRRTEKRAGDADAPAPDKPLPAREATSDDLLPESGSGVEQAMTRPETGRDAVSEAPAFPARSSVTPAPRGMEPEEIVDKEAPDTRSNTVDTGQKSVFAPVADRFGPLLDGEDPALDASSIPGMVMYQASPEPKMGTFLHRSTPETGESRQSKDGENVFSLGGGVELTRFATSDSAALQGAPQATGPHDAKGVSPSGTEAPASPDASETPLKVLHESDGRAPISPQIIAPDALKPAPNAASMPQTGHLSPHLPIRAGRFGSDLGVEISRRIVSGSSETVIRLDPADLGRIDVRMSLDADNSLKLVVSADNSSVLDLIRREAGDLMRALSDAGIRADSQHLRFDSQGSSTSQQWQGSGQGGGERRGRQPQRWFEEQPSTTSRHAIAGGRVDLMA